MRKVFTGKVSDIWDDTKITVLTKPKLRRIPIKKRKTKAKE